MTKALILENLNARMYNLIIEEKTEDGEKIPYLIIQHKHILNHYAKFSGSEAVTTYKRLKRLIRTGKSSIYAEECRKIVSTQMNPPVELPAAQLVPDAIVSNDIFVIDCPDLSTEQYERLKLQIDSNWPTHLPRPILLEGGITIRKMSFDHA